MKIRDSVASSRLIDEWPGNGRWELTLSQGLRVQVQAGSPAHALLEGVQGNLSPSQNDRVYFFTLNSVGLVVGIEEASE